MGRSLVCDVGAVALCDDGILVITIADGAELTLGSVRPLLALHRECAAGRRWPTIVDIRLCRRVDRAARDLVSGPEVAVLTTSLALIIGGPVSAMIGNFFLRVTRPDYPARVFSDVASAERWLLSPDTVATPASEADSGES